MTTGLALSALCLSLVGATVDVKSARVPNWLTCGGLVAGLLVRASLAGWSGLSSGLLGAVLGGGVLFLPFLARGIGGGDVKLMAAVGAWVGMGHSLAFILATAIAGGVLALAFVMMRRRRAGTIARVAHVVRFHLVFGVVPDPELHAQSVDSICVPYSLAIAAGALFVLISIAAPVWR